MSVAGTYDCTIRTPMGPQSGTLVVQPGADGTFSGSISGDMGAMDITGGQVNGQTLAWSMKMTRPMPIDLECAATVNGDTISGSVKAGMFGPMDLAGTRRA
jgi:choline dehydrogenase-like flavoprotein